MHPEQSPPILVIDDNPENLRVVVDVLESHGYTVRTARSGEKGIERAESVAPSLILLDVEMPEMDGYETCRCLKGDPVLSSIPVIFMTARADVADKVRGFEVGAVDYVTKPFEVHELLARVHTHIQLRALQDEVRDRNAELEHLNATLQERVEEQVAELVRRAQEIETLNANLRKQVHDRSEALALTLTRLSRRTSSHDDLVGTMLEGRYSIDKLIGIGGMGAVYSGWDQLSEQAVAIKVIRSTNPKSESMLRFIREARVAAAIDHPGVVKMLHIDVHDDGLLFQVQELVEGQTLSKALSRVKRFGVGQGARLLGTLAEALHAAHSAGIFHRDLKPSNVILTTSHPGLRLVDFGIAKREEQPVTESIVPSRYEGPTVEGEVLGTPRFMSPEQLRGGSVGAPSDVYTMGILAHLLWAEGVPTEDTTPQLPSELRPIIWSCLDEPPSARPVARELADAFHGVADTHDTPELQEIVSSGQFR